jgi:hypothetical protein
VEAEIKETYPDARVELVKGNGGVFDVECDGKRLFSKQYGPEPRFPRQGEIIGLLRRRK